MEALQAATEGLQQELAAARDTACGAEAEATSAHALQAAAGDLQRQLVAAQQETAAALAEGQAASVAQWQDTEAARGRLAALGTELMAMQGQLAEAQAAAAEQQRAAEEAGNRETFWQAAAEVAAAQGNAAKEALLEVQQAYGERTAELEAACEALAPAEQRATCLQAELDDLLASSRLAAEEQAQEQPITIVFQVGCSCLSCVYGGWLEGDSERVLVAEQAT